jgi:hypothetical protein
LVYGVLKRGNHLILLVTHLQEVGEFQLLRIKSLKREKKKKSVRTSLLTVN